VPAGRAQEDLTGKEAQAGGCRREIRWLECGRQGKGNEFPLPVSPSPRGDIPTVQYTGRITGKGRIRWPTGSTPDTASHQVSPRTDPAPGRGRGRSAAGAGGAGAAGRSVCLTSRRRGQGMPARSKMVGVWETGEGEQVPPPRQPLPPWRYLHGPAHGEIPEKTRARLHTRHRPRHGCSPDIATHGPRPPVRAGEERRRRGRGGGGRQKGMGIPAKARVGWGMPARYTGILLRRRVRGRPVEAYGYPLAKARAGEAGRSVWVSPCEGAGGVGAAGRGVWVSLWRRGQGMPARYPGIPTEAQAS